MSRWEAVYAPKLSTCFEAQEIKETGLLIPSGISNCPAEVDFRVDTAFKVAGQLVRPVAASSTSGNRAVGLPSRNNSQRC